ncbi:MAG TPA: hypothetical protein VF705_06990, partial [Longimicrobium sp.]
MHRSIESLIREAEDTGRPLHQVVLDTESAESGRPPEEIRGRIGRTLGIMRGAIDEGLKGEVRSASGLTGGRARKLWEGGPRLLGPR